MILRARLVSRCLPRLTPAVRLALGTRRVSSARHVRAGARKAPPSRADVIVVDGTNIAFSAAADRNRWGHLGATLAGCFGDYLAYFAAATGRPAERYVVFDRWKKDNVPLRRQQAYPDYLKTRTSRLAARKSRQQSTWKDRLADSLHRLLFGTEQKHNILWEAAQSQGYQPLEAQGGWEADDAIAALCKLIREGEGGGELRVAIVSNDSDLQQLVDERTEVLLLPPWHKEASGSPALVAVTAASFQQIHGFPPCVFPFMRALSGKKLSNVAGLGLSPARVRRLCSVLTEAVSQGASLEDGNLPPSFRRLLGNDARSLAQKLRSNLRLTVLHSGTDALPRGFRRQPAAAAVLRSSQQSVAEVAGAGLQVASPPHVAAGQHFERPSAATLVWMQPFNSGRAKYLQPHVTALCACLRRAGVRHRAWAVSQECLPMDIAILAEPSTLVRFGFLPHSVIMILGEGDLRRALPAAELPSPPPHSDGEVLEALKQPPPTRTELTPPAAMRLKALRRAGWHVHVVNHAMLQALLHYQPAALPFRP